MCTQLRQQRRAACRGAQACCGIPVRLLPLALGLIHVCDFAIAREQLHFRCTPRPVGVTGVSVPQLNTPLRVRELEYAGILISRVIAPILAHVDTTFGVDQFACA
jgi:hypothetical protein